MPSALLRLRSDEQLVALFRVGSDDAFRLIHDRYRARLFAYTRQMLGGSRTDAEDALQDVFLRAYHALRQDDRPIVLKAWLYRVAHNRCIDQIRRPTPPANEIFEMSRTPLPDPLEQAERREDLRRLVEDVQRLPEQQRSALLMREMEGLSYADLAAALDTSIPAVKSLLVRARIGLVEAAEARNTACSDIRDDLALSFGKGVRASAKARKHMRECSGCRAYRKELRTVSNGIASLTPAGHPLLGLLAKVLGIGGGAGGAAAGGSAVGGGAVAVGGGVVAGTTAKVAAVVCCAAVVGGGAVELKRHTPPSAGTAQTKKHESSRRGGEAPGVTARAATAGAAGGTAATARTSAPNRFAAATAATKAKHGGKKAKTIAKVAPLPAAEEVISPHVSEAEAPSLEPAPTNTDPTTGGAMAPSEPSTAPAQEPAGTTSGAASGTTASGTSTGSGTSSSTPTGSGTVVAQAPAATQQPATGATSPASPGPSAQAASQYPTAPATGQ